MSRAAPNSARRTNASRRLTRSQAGTANRLTELDYSVLGVVWRDGPLTTYAVRSRFASSVTEGWSASTGSIYPSIRRLVSFGFIRPSAHRDGRRTQDLRLTPRGLAVFRAWLRNITPGLAGNVADPVRTRVQFLGSLSRPEAARFLEEAEADCRSALGILKATLAKEAGGRGVERVGALTGARYELEARLEWLGWMRRQMRSASGRRR